MKVDRESLENELKQIDDEINELKKSNAFQKLVCFLISYEKMNFQNLLYRSFISYLVLYSQFFNSIYFCNYFPHFLFP